MFERYHIPIKTVPGRATPVPKFVITRADNCINCGKCEKACIYNVHKRSESDPRKMADPVNHLCKNCFRCIQDCPQRALTMAPGQDYRALGRGIWSPLRISTIWGEAETGKIPVLGAGYRGMFAGPGYDGMWTDMSEIVRPTRDGIHGREYISTSVDLGSRPPFLEFDGEHHLISENPTMIELPVPFIMDLTRLRNQGENVSLGLAKAARHLDTLVLIPAGSLTSSVAGAAGGRLVPVLPEGADVDAVELVPGIRMIEFQLGTEWERDVKVLRSRFPEAILAARIAADDRTEKRALALVKAKVEVAHIEFDENGMESDGSDPRHSKDSLKSVHRALVSKKVRDEITIIAGGGIAAAEHVPKTIICGADAVALEKALVIALECRDCIACSEGSCQIALEQAPAEWVEARAVNMVGAWRDQLLEVLGAMGIREVRRLRGELGRAIFYEDVERESFSEIEGGGTND